MQIAVIDDNHLQCETSKDIIIATTNIMSIDLYMDSYDALGEVVKLKHDMYIIESAMEGMTGLRLAKHILMEVKDVRPIMVLTTFAVKSLYREFDFVVEKPITVNKMSQLFASVSDGVHLRADSANLLLKNMVEVKDDIDILSDILKIYHILSKKMTLNIALKDVYAFYADVYKMNEDYVRQRMYDLMRRNKNLCDQFNATTPKDLLKRLAKEYNYRELVV